MSKARGGIWVQCQCRKLPMEICSPSCPRNMKEKKQVPQYAFVIFNFRITGRECPVLDSMFTLLITIFSSRCPSCDSSWKKKLIWPTTIGIIKKKTLILASCKCPHSEPQTCTHTTLSYMKILTPVSKQFTTYLRM